MKAGTKYQNREDNGFAPLDQESWLRHCLAPKNHGSYKCDGDMFGAYTRATFTVIVAIFKGKLFLLAGYDGRPVSNSKRV